MKKKKFRFILEKASSGYSAFEEALPIYTTGKTLLELQSNALEATTLYLEEGKPLPKKEDLSFEIDLQQFFEYYKMINCNYLAERIGMNATLLSQYVNGKKKPSQKQVNRIVDGLHEIGKEPIELSLV